MIDEVMDDFLTIIGDIFNNEFDSFESSSQRISYAFDKIDSIEDLQRNIHQFMSNHMNKNGKSLSKSQEYRYNGNRYFNETNYEYALYFYNLAVMCAPYPSDTSEELEDELSYAYTSRSLTFFEMECYENALFDIDCALLLSSSMNFSNRLELMLHKVYCMSSLGRNEESKQLISFMIQLIPCFPKNNQIVEDLIQIRESLSHAKDKSLKEMNTTQHNLNLIEGFCKNIDNYIDMNCQLAVTQLKGRYFRAKKSIPNRTIVMIDKTYTGILFKSFFPTHCQNCFKNICYKYWPCKQCNQVVFCDEECAEEAFYHRYECGIADLFEGLGATNYIVFRIVSRIGPKNAIKLAKQLSHVSKNNTDMDQHMRKYIEFLKLKDHSEGYDLKTKVLCTYRSIELAIIFNYFDEFKFDNKDLVQNMKELAMILESNFYKVSINAFGMYEQKTKSRSFRGRHIGNAVCLMPSFFNHSCAPNLFWQFNGNHMTVITTRDVRSGEELSISYGPRSETMSFDERQNLLKNQYFFKCNCSSCISDAKELQTLKCDNCSEGLIIYNCHSIKGSCIVCTKEYEISVIIERVEEIDKSFEYWKNEFAKQTDSESLLINAEKCFQQFSELLYGKSRKMSEISFELSRSFQLFGNYSKAMFYSKKVLESFDHFESGRYAIQMVFFSQVYYQYLYRERASFIRDKEWDHCFQAISQTILILRKCRKQLMTIFAHDKSESNELKSAEKRIDVIKHLLIRKEKQICFILGLNSY